MADERHNVMERSEDGSSLDVCQEIFRSMKSKGGRALRRLVFLRVPLILAALFLVAGSSVLPAQYPTARKTEKKTDNPRAVGVLEWTGQPGKPSASRLIPISIFIDGKLQDGGLYMARPAPMTLESGTVYELELAGKPMGLFDIGSAGHIESGDFQNAWFGYGVWKPLSKPAPPRRVQMAANPPTRGAAVTDPDRPTLIRRQPAGGSTGGTSQPPNSPAPGSPAPGSPAPNSPAPGSQAPPSSTPAGKPGGKGDSSADTIDSNGNATPNSQPGNAGNASKGSGGSTGSSTQSAGNATGSTAGNAGGGAPAQDPDRPTLKRRSASEASGSTTGGAASGEYMPGPDPNRPRLHRGKPEGEEADEATQLKLAGAPPNLQQMVAVSDATNREPHTFMYSWSDAQQAAALQAKVEQIAQKALGNYGGATGTKSAPTPQATRARSSSTKTPASGKPRHTASGAAAAKGPQLLDVKFSAYELSYEGGATLVLTAHTDGTGAQLKYVTVVAVVDIYGEPQVLLKSVTDAAHLDETPWMRLVDVVDVDASNRAALLFELHGVHQRQFAVYRVARGTAEQVLVTDPIP